MEPSTEDRTQRSRRRRRVVILLVFIGLILALIFAFRAVLAPFLIALFVAYLLDPVVDRLAEVRPFGKFRLGRGGSIVIIYLVFLLAVYLAATKAIPAFGRQLRQAREDLPAAQAWAEESAEYFVQKWTEFMGPEEKAEEPESPGGEPTEPPDPRTRFHMKGGGAIEGQVVARVGSQVVVQLGNGVQVLDQKDVDQEEPLEGAEEREVDMRQLIRSGITQSARHLDSVLAVTVKFAIQLTKILYLAVLIMMVTAFLVVDSKAIITFLQSVPPIRYRETYKRLGYYIDRGLAGVI
ncbi:MAG: AI-2E family transporter, partial [Planctomycetota bacterium]